MLHFSPILACGNVLTTRDVVLLLALAVGWFSAAILCLFNIVIIFRASRAFSFRLTHLSIFLSYIGLAIFLFCLEKIITNEDIATPIGRTLTVGIPLVVIGHFIYLLICRRRFKHETERAA